MRTNKRNIKILFWVLGLCVIAAVGAVLSPSVSWGEPKTERLNSPKEALSSQAYIVGNSQQELLRFARKHSSSKFNYNNFFEAFLNQFKGYPYGAGTPQALKGLKEGQTMINFETMDCVTFIENFFATALLIKNYNTTLAHMSDVAVTNAFLDQLNQVRYYNGANCTWEDRIYYFTHALEVLESKGYLTDIGAQAGVKFKKKINYLSQNKTKFPGIKDWKRIQNIEQQISTSGLAYFPLDKLHHYEKIAQTGDIIALATNVPGLDVSHCGFIHSEEQALYFTHASSTRKKVVFREDFRYYLNTRDSITGIFVYRSKL